jgi:hypothetical protein
MRRGELSSLSSGRVDQTEMKHGKCLCKEGADKENGELMTLSLSLH